MRCRKYGGKFIWLGLIFILLPSFSQTDVRVEIYGLRSHVHPNFTRIVVDIGKLREYYYSELRNPDRVYVDIYQTKLNPLLHGQSYPVNADYIQQIRIAQKSPTTVRVVVDLDFSKTRQYQIFHLFDPFRIVVDIYPLEKKAVARPQKQQAQAEKKTEEIETQYSMVRQLGLGVRRVVIDPGHGGRDPGCIGRSGLKEKDIVLKIALYLKQLLLENKDLEVVLTRETDITVIPEDRTVIANQQNADLFISIHINANRDRKLSGVETFYLNFSEDPSVNETAARENATSTKNISEMTSIIEKIVSNSKIIESKVLARTIHTNLVNSLDQWYANVRDLGVKGGPFWVLIGGEMPSALVEVSYLSNPMEEERLKSSRYLKNIAQGIYNGIMEYINSLRQG